MTITKHHHHDSAYDHGEMLMKRGRWSLWLENVGSTLWHQCSKEMEKLEGEKDNVVVYPISYYKYSRDGRHMKPAWKCGMCRKIPPESILSTWLLHNFDTVSDQMNTYDYRPKGWPGT